MPCMDLKFSLSVVEEPHARLLDIVLLLTDLRGTAVLWKLHGCCVKCHLHCPAGDIIQDRVYNFMKDL